MFKKNKTKTSSKWHHGLVVVTTAQLYSAKPEFRLCTGSNPSCGMSEVCDGQDLGRSWL